MIDRAALLSDLQKLLSRLEVDLRERSEEVPEIGARLKEEFDRAQGQGRTGRSFVEWRAETITQAAAAWVLSAVFARFLEDNDLVQPPRVSGSAERLNRARDEQEIYFRANPRDTDREYLLSVFHGLSDLPGAGDLFGRHNPLHFYPGWPSGDGAHEILAFFQRIVPETGVLVHDFTDAGWSTRFLGDLYRDLSAAAQAKYALKQTPDFIQEFILDRTLDPALGEFGLEGFRMIDPACGSGHFLLGAYERIFGRWIEREPATNARVLAQRALDSVYGVDLNPYAVAIARFRLLLSAMQACGVKALRDAPDFEIHLACGDSLLHGMMLQSGTLGNDYEHVYQPEDMEELRRILQEEHDHAVVANPPYITVKDKALNAAYRDRYPVCHRRYSLAVPFMQRMFKLARPGGFVGQITANSFVKREFGKKLVEKFIKTIDLTHVIDTSGAYIPGHGAPTVILFARRPKRHVDGHPIMRTSPVRAVMGIRGEPSTPEDPANGLVWSAIVNQVDVAGSESDYVSVADVPRDTFQQHPWSIGGGGAAELKELLDNRGGGTLANHVSSIGFVCITKQDDVFSRPHPVFLRHRLEADYVRQFGIGEEIRDWGQAPCEWVLFPYDESVSTATIPAILRFIWPLTTSLEDRKVFGGHTYREVGKPWYEYGQIPPDRLRTPLSIAFAFVATHNHFVLDRGGKVFNRSAPVIKLPAGASEDDHLALLGPLNSSTACFWMKQVFFNKGSTVDQHGARQRTIPFEDFWEHDGTMLGSFRVVAPAPVDRARGLDALARRLTSPSPAEVLRRWQREGGELAQALDRSHRQWQETRRAMIARQEELD